MLGQRRDPDVELEALSGFAAAASEAERPGIERFIDRTSEQQQQANAELAQMLEKIESDDLRGRLAALIAPPPAAPVGVDPEQPDAPADNGAPAPSEGAVPPAKSGWLRRR